MSDEWPHGQTRRIEKVEVNTPPAGTILFQPGVPLCEGNLLRDEG